MKRRVNFTFTVSRKKKKKIGACKRSFGLHAYLDLYDEHRLSSALHMWPP